MIDGGTIESIKLIIEILLQTKFKIKSEDLFKRKIYLVKWDISLNEDLALQDHKLIK